MNLEPSTLMLEFDKHFPYINKIQIQKNTNLLFWYYTCIFKHQRGEF